jgi:peptidyl-dipeptidase A
MRRTSSPSTTSSGTSTTTSILQQAPVLFQQGANDGFHEAIGDAVALSMTPDLPREARDPRKDREQREGLINLQMKDALEKVAFLPFGYSSTSGAGTSSPARRSPPVQQAWWDAAHRVPGHRAPRRHPPEDAFDPGAKYHIPANVPYARYFLARILQFQFHKALCEAAGHQGPLHTCSIYGNKEAGAKLERDARAGRERAVARRAEALTGTERDGCAGAARLLRAAVDVAQGAEQGQEVRLVKTRARAAPSVTGDGNRRWT